jgi:hypothetical protein
MAYAARDDVLLRAGRFAGVFQVAGKRPNEADLDELLDDVSAVIDAEIRSRGYDPATLDADLTAALKDVTAWAVLLRSLPQANPGEDAEELLERADAIVTAAGFPSLSRSGATDVFAALDALEAGEGGGGPGSSAGSFWDEVSDEETVPSVRVVNGELVLETFSSSEEPLWKRGQSL